MNLLVIRRSCFCLGLPACFGNASFEPSLAGHLRNPSPNKFTELEFRPGTSPALKFFAKFITQILVCPPRVFLRHESGFLALPGGFGVFIAGLVYCRVPVPAFVASACKLPAHDSMDFLIIFRISPWPSSIHRYLLGLSPAWVPTIRLGSSCLQGSELSICPSFCRVAYINNASCIWAAFGLGLIRFSPYLSPGKLK